MRLENLLSVPRSAADDLVDETALLREEVARLRAKVAQLERLAATDTLTPLANRRVFIREIERVIGRYERYGVPAAIMFLDVDRLKQINDVHGHLAGDAALIHVARVLSQEVRATDTVARIGGDEFGVVLDQIGEGEVRAKAAALAERVAAEPLTIDGVPVAVTLSIGVASVVATDNADSLLSRADADMYCAKRRQRSDR